MQRRWKLTARATLMTAALVTFSAVAAPAAFAGREESENMWSDEVCKSPSASTFKFKLWYNSWNEGPYRNFGYAVWDFGFLKDGFGSVEDPLRFCNSSQPVKNNAASAKNAHSTYSAQVFYNSGFKGAKDVLPPLSSTSRLDNTYNDNASYNWTS